MYLSMLCDDSLRDLWAMWLDFRRQDVDRRTGVPGSDYVVFHSKERRVLEVNATRFSTNGSINCLPPRFDLLVFRCTCRHLLLGCDKIARPEHG